MPSVNHYLNRAKEIGVTGTLKRVWNKTGGATVQRGQSIYWRVKATRPMSDEALLATLSADWTGIGAVVQHLALRKDSSFLLALDPADKTAPALDARYPGLRTQILVAADMACARTFKLLNQDASYPGEIAWQRCPATGWDWPDTHISIIDDIIWEPDRPADFKMVWEVNRHAHFVTLGLAYRLTGEERYLNAFIDQLQNWIEANPPEHGVNWFSALEVAIRLINWTMAFQLFRTAGAFQEKASGAFLKSLYQQTVFLKEHLTTYERVPNNHLIGETAALAMVGAIFPEFKDSADWRESGLRSLNDAVRTQTHSDGVNKEQATGYMRFVAEFLLVVILPSRRDLLPRQPDLEATLERMFGYMRHIAGISGVGPLWGDSDDGYAIGLPSAHRFWDIRWLLAVGAVLFERGDFKQIAGEFGTEAYWLLGAQGFSAWERLDAHAPAETSQAFTDGGMVILRDSWQPDTDLLMFRCGPWGLGGEGASAHSHCDMLAALLWVKGRALLVDSGTYRYHGPVRDEFRRTASHNTLMVDGREQAAPINYFSWKDVPDAECLSWDTTHVTGAMDVAPGVRHERAIAHEQPDAWTIADRVADRDGGSHALAWHFHFAPDLALRVSNDGHAVVVEEANLPYVRITPPEGVTLSIEQGWFSDQYNLKVENAVLVATYEGPISREGVHFGWSFQYVGKTGD
ncbi:MAG TPA: alginate lyase family protein [Aggregatilinea sp.]|uniref:alginate lyase family protein n=1 Tax=Aggregatilinea sp. TaxID=2806333 RepID=UPI002D07A737|nr:alginate lyase family protein [Aggregatilinea sp.]HML20743.1 alginate lyase family protein [Aggregatilinea sp.]